MGQKWGAVPLWGGGAGSRSNTMWPAPSPTCMPSFILICPTVWPQCTNVTDRQHRQTGQTTDRWRRANRFTSGRPKTLLRLYTMYFRFLPVINRFIYRSLLPFRPRRAAARPHSGLVFDIAYTLLHRAPDAVIHRILAGYTLGLMNSVVSRCTSLTVTRAMCRRIVFSAMLQFGGGNFCTSNTYRYNRDR